MRSDVVQMISNIFVFFWGVGVGGGFQYRDNKTAACFTGDLIVFPHILVYVMGIHTKSVQEHNL